MAVAVGVGVSVGVGVGVLVGVGEGVMVGVFVAVGVLEALRIPTSAMIIGSDFKKNEFRSNPIAGDTSAVEMTANRTTKDIQ